MLSRIISAIPEGNRKFPLRYIRMTNCILDRMTLAKNRYLLAHTIQTPGMELLRFILLNLDIDELDSYSTDEDRYTEVIKFYRDKFRSVIDPVFSNSIAGGKLVRRVGAYSPNEIFLNCEALNPSEQFPFNRDWPDWQNLRGLRLIYHNSLELPENFYSSLFDFVKQKPTFMTFAIDVSVLAFKYYKYVKYCQNEHLPVNTNDFLKQYEYSHFFEDLFDIWNFNLILKIFCCPSLSTDDIIKDVVMPIRFCTTNMLQMGIDNVKEFVTLVQTGAMRPQDFLATKWFQDGSLSDKMNHLRNTVCLPSSLRYMWLRTIEWFPYLFMIMNVCRMFPDNPLTSVLETRCKEIWTLKFKTVSMPSGTTDPVLGNLIKRLQAVIGEFLTGNTVIYPNISTVIVKPELTT